MKELAKATCMVKLELEFLSGLKTVRGHLSDADAAIKAVRKGHSRKLGYIRVTQRLSLSFCHKHVGGFAGGDGEGELLIASKHGPTVGTCVRKVATGRNVADVGTKVIDTAAFLRHCHVMGVRFLPEGGILQDSDFDFDVPEEETSLVAELADALKGRR